MISKTSKDFSSFSEQEKKDIFEKIKFMRRFTSCSPGMIARKVGLTIQDMEKLIDRYSDKILTGGINDVGEKDDDLGKLGLSELRTFESEKIDNGA